MKKLVVLLAMSALSVSVFAMSKAPADSSACGTNKACSVKDAASCAAANGSCKMDAAKADAVKAAGDMKTCGGTCAGSCGCEGKKAVKAVEEKAAGCAGGVCPLSK